MAPGNREAGDRVGRDEQEHAERRGGSRLFRRSPTRRHGRVFSTAISPATKAIHTMLMTPSANRDAISAQQHPTHQAPFFAPIRSAPDRPSRQEPSSSAERAAAFAEADVLERRQLVDRRDDERRARDPSPGAIPGEHVARGPAAGRRDREGERPGDAPRDEIARPRRGAARAASAPWSCGRTARRSARPTGTSSRPSSPPRRRGTSRTFPARSTARRPSPASGRPSTTSRPRRGRTGERRARAGRARPQRPGRAPRRRGLGRTRGRSRGQAAQENSDVERPVLPS